MSHKHPPSTGEERSQSERQSIYVDPNLRKQKRAEARALNQRYAELCGPVTVTKVSDDVHLSHLRHMEDQ